MLLNISDNCQQNNSAGTPFWIKIGLGCRPATTFIKKDTLAQVFSCKCRKTFIRTPASNKRWKNWIDIIQKQPFTDFLLFIKRQTSDKSSDNEWQRMTMSGRYNEWQRVVQRETTKDNEWQRVTTNDNEWQQMTMNGRFC